MSISLAQLQRQLTDLATPEAELASGFELDPQNEWPLRPQLRVNTRTVQVDDRNVARAAVIASQCAWWSLLRRRQRWEQVSSQVEGADAHIVAAGDSWFHYPVLIRDVVDRLLDQKLTVRTVDGASLDDLLRNPNHLDALRETGASVLLLSVGGAEALGAGNLQAHLRNVDARAAAADHLLPSYHRLLDQTLALYERVLREVEALPGRVVTICHGYDYPCIHAGINAGVVAAAGSTVDPQVSPQSSDEDGPTAWIGQALQDRGITDPAMQCAIAHRMIDLFNDGLRRLAAGFGENVIYLDLRGSVAPDAAAWHDELHPGPGGFDTIAQRFAAAIADARSRVAGDNAPYALRSRRWFFGGRTALGSASASGAAAAAPKKLGRKGISLHIGLNQIDASHYGTDGTLRSAESDARDMAQLCKEAKFEDAELLLGERATRDALRHGIAEAASKLSAGDLFVFSYAGLGATLPDFNRDELDDGLDESFCLHDGMLIDDELYELWARFEDDVRVVVLSDASHGPMSGEHPRRLAPEFAARTFRAHRSAYIQQGTDVRGGGEGWLGREIARPLRCSVLLLAGCQPNQACEDGAGNGRFTQRLMDVWRDGQFSGDYRVLFRQIANGMPAAQSPMWRRFGKAPDRLVAQRPFAV